MYTNNLEKVKKQVEQEKKICADVSLHSALGGKAAENFRNCLSNDVLACIMHMMPKPNDSLLMTPTMMAVPTL